MLYTILGGIGGLLIIMPNLMYDISTQGTYWMGSKIYRYYYPEIKDIDLLKIEVDKLKFEFDEYKNKKWIKI